MYRSGFFKGTELTECIYTLREDLLGCGSGSPTMAASRWQAENLVVVQSTRLDGPAPVIWPWSLGAFLLPLVSSVCWHPGEVGYDTNEGMLQQPDR